MFSTKRTWKAGALQSSCGDVKRRKKTTSLLLSLAHANALQFVFKFLKHESALTALDSSCKVIQRELGLRFFLRDIRKVGEKRISGEDPRALLYALVKSMTRTRAGPVRRVVWVSASRNIATRVCLLTTAFEAQDVTNTRLLIYGDHLGRLQEAKERGLTEKYPLYIFYRLAGSQDYRCHRMLKFIGGILSRSEPPNLVEDDYEFYFVWESRILYEGDGSLGDLIRHMFIQEQLWRDRIIGPVYFFSDHNKVQEWLYEETIIRDYVGLQAKEYVFVSFCTVRHTKRTLANLTAIHDEKALTANRMLLFVNIKPGDVYIRTTGIRTAGII